MPVTEQVLAYGRINGIRTDKKLMGKSSVIAVEKSCKYL